MAIAGMDSSSDSQRRRLALVGLALAAIIFLGVNVLANAAFTSWQLDLTEDELYSLSPGTSTVLAAIDEPIAVELYFSDGLGQRSPLHANFYNRVRELLERYADLSGGRLQLDIRNPQPFTDVEDRAVASGLQGVPLGDSGDLGYFGLVASNSTDGQEVVPFFNAERERFVEYDLTSLIHRLANPKKKVLAVLSSLPVLGAGRAGRPAPPWLFTEQIGNFFDVRPMTIFDKQVPDDADLLLIIPRASTISSNTPSTSSSWAAARSSSSSTPTPKSRRFPACGCPTPSPTSTACSRPGGRAWSRTRWWATATLPSASTRPAATGRWWPTTWSG